MAKVATVGVVGRTNAGKSTLVNALVGEKVSIVSPVEQTTRNTVRGIVADPRGQLVLLDTPGLHKAVGRLGTLLNRMARASSAGVDILCVVFDAAEEPQMEDLGWMSRVAKEAPEKVVFVLNKLDVKPFFASMFRDAWKEASAGSAVAPVWVETSASTPGGEAPVADALFSLAEEGEPLFPDDIATDYPRKLAIADIVREKFLAVLRKEIPHELGVVVKRIDENGDRWKIFVDALVNRPSQKPIVVGRAAQNVKRARKSAEREVGDLFGVKATMELWVRVEPKWMENPRILAEMGYLGGEI
jgi:GTP-binding protein Era